MPTYNYKCTSCNHQFTVLQSMSDKPVETCDSCEGEVKRIISGGTGMIFKGDGFYLTDYARKKNGSENGEKSPAEKKNKPKAEKTTKNGESSE